MRIRIAKGNDHPSSDGWGHKVLLLVKRPLSSPVTITGVGVNGEGPLRFDDATGQHGTSLILGRQHIPPEKGWNMYPSHFYVPRAGCYSLKAAWPGGGWTVTFAAGTPR